MEQCDLPGLCNDKHCDVTRDFVPNLRTSIEVLEAEISSLQFQLITYKDSETLGPTKTVISKRKTQDRKYIPNAEQKSAT